jgi:TonB family protein
MALSGNTRELSLADLILVKAQDPGTYRLRLNGPAGDGLLFIRGGRVVHASYGELPAEDAAYLLVTEESVEFQVEADASLQGQTLDLSAQELLIEAMRRFDEGVLKKPKPISFHVVSGVSTRREPPRPRAHEAKKSPEAEALRRATGRVLFAEPEPRRTFGNSAWGLVAIGLGLAAVAGFGYRAGWLSPSPVHRDPVSVSDLDGPRDIVPLLLSGGPGVAPADAHPLPTIVYRIVVDRNGNVHPERPHQRREGLDSFEAAAREALLGYRFAPGLREGVAVSVRMNWPVDFVHRAAPSATPVPVGARFFNGTYDKLPVLVEGDVPETPLPERPLRPKIVCLILVDEDGNVQEASVASSRPDLETYERKALETVRTYKFTPGVREDVVVPTWMEWPIEFR